MGDAWHGRDEETDGANCRFGGVRNLEYLENGTQQPGALRLEGVKAWSGDPSTNPNAAVKAEFKLGDACAAV